MTANMGGYISVGTNDLESAKKFYDHAFEGLEIKVLKATIVPISISLKAQKLISLFSRHMMAILRVLGMAQ
tara:strand:- start:9359 stop:9571 length:213 start_codon:yes stop_codon:yes gene_type:complete